jgi:cysteine-rich repeat protein
VYVADPTFSVVRRIDLASGSMTVVAGKGQGFAGDGGPAADAQIAYPNGVAVDLSGNVFISDSANGRIRRVDAATGLITTVAGGGSIFGDDIPATSAYLEPWGLAVDRHGNLFVADRSNARVSRIDVDTGLIHVVAGGSAIGDSGDGGPATSASLWEPIDVAVDDNDNLFIADWMTGKIRKVDGATQIISTFVGGGFAFAVDGAIATDIRLGNPTGIGLDPAGNLFVQSGAALIRVDVSTATITVLAGGGSGQVVDGGPAISAAVLAYDVAADESGNVFIADEEFSLIRRVDALSGIITTVAGNGSFGYGGDGGPASQGQLNQPSGIAFDPRGDLYIADTSNHRVRHVTASSGMIETIAGTGSMGFAGDGGPARDALLNSPSALVVDQDGAVYVADRDNGRIRRIDPVNAKITTFAGGGPCCAYGDGGPATEARLNKPNGLAFDRDGNLFIADLWAGTVRRVDAVTQIITTVAGGGAYYVGDNVPATESYIGEAAAVAVDPSGNLFIGDVNFGFIRRVDAETKIITTLTPVRPGQFKPNSIVLDGHGGLLVADTTDDTIWRIDLATRTFSAIAGNLGGGFNGDERPATTALLNWPSGLAFDPSGNLFVADQRNNRIRWIDHPGYCGDGQLDGGEECDDGNNVNGDGCDQNCTRPRCGNGVIDPGEECDTGQELNQCCFGDCTLYPAETVCRFAENQCDIAEYCDGVSGFCPIDRVEPAWTPCYSDGDPCTIDTCSGLSATCLHSPSADSDSDGICDAVDPCTNVNHQQDFLTRPHSKLTITKSLGPPGDQLDLSADFLLEATLAGSAVDPVRDGVRIVIIGQAATVLDVSFPPGLFGGPGTRGWKRIASHPTWQFLDATTAPLGGITKLHIQRIGRDIPVRMRISAKGRHGNYQVSAPYHVTVVLGGLEASVTGECGEGEFLGSDCRLSSQSSKIRCVR